jgi:hypothetical protein
MLRVYGSQAPTVKSRSHEGVEAIATLASHLPLPCTCAVMGTHPFCGDDMGILTLFELASRMDRAAIAFTRFAMIIVPVWIDGLKAAKYEPDGIVPFVANSPLMKFFYADPGDHRAHMNPERALVPANPEIGVRSVAGRALNSFGDRRRDLG